MCEGQSSAFFKPEPAGTIAVPAPGSEADILSTMRQWLAEHETISQMDAWWQARTQLPQPMHSVMSINMPHQWSVIL